MLQIKSIRNMHLVKVLHSNKYIIIINANVFM